MDKQKRLTEIIMSAFILAVSTYLLQIAYTSKIRTKVQGMNSMAFPKAILYLLIALCLYVAITGVINLKKENSSRRLDKKTGDQEKSPIIAKEVALSVGLIILYAIGWQFIGFILSSILFVFVESRILDPEKPWWHAVLVAVGYTLLVYFTFSLGFGVSFPEPILSAIGL